MDNLNKITNSVSSVGKSKIPQDFNTLQEYLDLYNKKPSTFTIINENKPDYYDFKPIETKLKKLYDGFEILFTDRYYNITMKCYSYTRKVIKLKDGYILDLSLDTAKDTNKTKCSELISYNTLLTPCENDEGYDKELVKELIKVFNKNKIVYTVAETSLGMVSLDDGELCVKDFVLDGKIVDMIEPDLHYGEGFNDFYKQLLNKLRVETKGLVLLHGKPGTGKTFLIRQLLKELSKSDKNILYFSPSMVDVITDPSFIEFITTWTNESIKKGILLIEDAEPLLVDRKNERNVGITNLLNLSDGLLNDILGVQIICTFNTELSNIDEALLRDERLIARKEFKTLSKDDALVLAKLINLDESLIKDNMTLAEIYAHKKNNKTIVHDVDKGGKKIGFK